jgi:hypothetical protein
MHAGVAPAVQHANAMANRSRVRRDEARLAGGRSDGRRPLGRSEARAAAGRSDAPRPGGRTVTFGAAGRTVMRGAAGRTAMLGEGGGGQSDAGSAGGRSAARLGIEGTASNGADLAAGRSDRRRRGARAASALLAGRREPSVAVRQGVAAQTCVSLSSRAQGAADPKPVLAAS